MGARGGLHAGRPDRHALRRAGPDLGLRLRGRGQHPDRHRGRISAGARRTTCATASRSTATPAWRSSGPRSPRSSWSAPRSTAGSCSPTSRIRRPNDARRSRSRPSSSPGPSTTRTRASSSGRRAAPGQGHAVPASSSAPRTCSTPSGCREFRMKKDAVPGIDDRRARHAHPHRPLHARLRGALRPRPLHDARDASSSRTRRRSTAGPRQRSGKGPQPGGVGCGGARRRRRDAE